MLVVAEVNAQRNAAIATTLIAIVRNLMVDIAIEKFINLDSLETFAPGIVRKVKNIVQIEEGSAQFCSVVTNTWTCILAWSGWTLWNIFLMLTWTRMV
jgi:hypothetical protein